MAISRMTKIIIVSHHTDVGCLLEALQKEGICQILNAEEAIVSKEWPELIVEADRPREVEELINRLRKSIYFLQNYAPPIKGTSVLAPRPVIEEKKYLEVVRNRQLLDILSDCEKVDTSIDKLKNETESTKNFIEQLAPWQSLQTPLEDLYSLEHADSFIGLIPAQYFKSFSENSEKLGAVIQQVGQTINKYACIIVCLKSQSADVQKALRSADFEPVNFENIKGNVAQIIAANRDKLKDLDTQLQLQIEKTKTLSQSILGLKVLYDHYTNILSRENTKSNAPATEQVLFLEGWVREKDFARLEKIILKFKAASVNKTQPAEGEEPPVEIENNKYIRPFESITRLYGMPSPTSVDPTVFLAPFFAIFFGLCLTDVGYGLIMILIFWYFLRKMQGDKKLIWMLLICSITTVIGGAITGSWFGDGIQQFIPALDGFRQKMILFDPFVDPMTFFALSLAFGYIQIMCGITIGLIHNIIRKDYIAAFCDQLTWLVWLNSIFLIGFSSAGVIHPMFGNIAKYVMIVPALTIVLFSQREGSWGSRIGMGAYQLFSTVFYGGDILSYVRLMALGMVTGGFGMAINVLVKLLMGLPYVGYILGAIVFVVGHTFSIAMSALGSFVHSLRLQFIEFFPKFFSGGGRIFQPFDRKYDYIYLKETKE